MAWERTNRVSRKQAAWERTKRALVNRKQLEHSRYGDTGIAERSLHLSFCSLKALGSWPVWVLNNLVKYCLLS